VKGTERVTLLLILMADSYSRSEFPENFTFFGASVGNALLRVFDSP